MVHTAWFLYFTFHGNATPNVIPIKQAISAAIFFVYLIFQQKLQARSRKKRGWPIMLTKREFSIETEKRIIIRTKPSHCTANSEKGIIKTIQKGYFKWISARVDAYSLTDRLAWFMRYMHYS